MPTEVKTRPSESLPPKLRATDKYPEHDPKTAAHKVTQQQQQQHREALRLALGSILSPKRPPMNGSRSSSGSTTPLYPFPMSSGPHTPAGSPPAYYPLAHGPNSSDYLHSHHPHHPHLYHPHPHTPSRLGRSKSSSGSPSGSGENTASNSSLSSPLPPVSNNLPVPPEIEPLPPAQIANGVASTANSTTPPTRPPNTPYQPTNNNAASGSPPIPTDHPSADSADHAARAGTPRSGFLQTLQSKSAWDALIHGSFS
ncbi:hypothetical protein BYT27DRAFT_7187114 [Phlegmacium glaucopus]|nr:hypothetical protein BYT27DRAFT_7187114 [Phlegmacium glaucopus]